MKKQKTEKIKLAEKFEHISVENLLPYARNARTHSDEQLEQIAKSINEFGFLNPVLIDAETKTIIAGHGRVMAAKKLGMTTIPVVTLDHLSEEQRRAYVIADNKLALNAGWDFEILSEEMLNLDKDGFDLAITGFSLAEIEEITVDGDANDNGENQDEPGDQQKQVECPECGHEFAP